MPTYISKKAMQVGTVHYTVDPHNLGPQQRKAYKEGVITGVIKGDSLPARLAERFRADRGLYCVRVHSRGDMSGVDEHGRYTTFKGTTTSIVMVPIGTDCSRVSPLALERATAKLTARKVELRLKGVHPNKLSGYGESPIDFSKQWNHLRATIILDPTKAVQMYKELGLVDRYEGDGVMDAITIQLEERDRI